MLSESPKTIDITGFFKKFCIATRTILDEIVRELRRYAQVRLYTCRCTKHDPFSKFLDVPFPQPYNRATGGIWQIVSQPIPAPEFTCTMQADIF